MKKIKLKFSCIILAFIFIGMLPLYSCTNIDYSSNNDNPQHQQTIYEVDNTQFAFVQYKPRTYTTVSTQGGGTTLKYVLSFTSSCAVSLYEYTAYVKLYSETNTLLETQTITKSNNIEANSNFNFDVEVSYNVQVSTASVEVIFAGKSYDKPGIITPQYQVTFVYNNGTPNSSVVVKEGETVPTPKSPQKTNYSFNGWYTDVKCVKEYNFSKKVTRNITLYAKYDIDAVTITNKISTGTIKSIVKIYNKSYNTTLGIETSSYSVQGSGFCFHIQNGYYYVLTNCHVAQKRSSYDKQKLTIEDYQGNTYEGFLYKNPNKSDRAIDPSYELACLYFKPTSTNVESLSLTSINPDINDDIISLGAPNGQANTITYGTILNYQKISLSDTPTYLSNVTFDVINHNAYGAGGSSGGPLLNSNLEVVGVNYAGSKNGGTHAFSIPVEKVVEFLEIYVFN